MVTVECMEREVTALNAPLDVVAYCLWSMQTPVSSNVANPTVKYNDTLLQ